ncbi:MAG: GGDEF domain-containing protein [Pseudohongiellaceae bacterium]
MPSPYEDEPTHRECPAGNHLCPHLPEVIKLREEVRELSALVRTDELTGLFNFRFFNQAVELEMERTRRSGQPTVLIMMDLDHFKVVNDAYGHEVGNHALTYVAKIITNTIRRLDIPCRYGGEEFALILPDTDLSPGVLFANRLRLIMESARIEIQGVDIKLTASLGVAVFQKGDELSPREFIDKVDGFLYEAKQAGRNRVRHPVL